MHSNPGIGLCRKIDKSPREVETRTLNHNLVTKNKSKRNQKASDMEALGIAG
jgi:hypothetical protein